jgi:hypothetical protein
MPNDWLCPSCARPSPSAHWCPFRSLVLCTRSSRCRCRASCWQGLRLVAGGLKHRFHVHLVCQEVAQLLGCELDVRSSAASQATLWARMRNIKKVKHLCTQSENGMQLPVECHPGRIVCCAADLMAGHQPFAVVLQPSLRPRAPSSAATSRERLLDTYGACLCMFCVPCLLLCTCTRACGVRRRHYIAGDAVTPRIRVMRVRCPLRLSLSAGVHATAKSSPNHLCRNSLAEVVAMAINVPCCPGVAAPLMVLQEVSQE